MTHREHNPEEYYPPTSRIEAFSDGVLAIIITLLVLEMKIPNIPHGVGAVDLLHSLWPVLPKLLSFTVSFLVIAIFWVNHHNLFHQLEHSSRGLLWTNNLLLFWLCLVPFPTALLGDHPTNWVAVAIYGATLSLAAGSFTLMVKQAYKEGLYLPDIDDGFVKAQIRRSMPGLTLYATSVILAPVSIYVSYAIFFLVPIYYFLPSRIRFMISS